MAETLRLVSKNILEDGTLTVTGGTAQSSYPASRLYDWSKNFLWKVVTGSSIEAAEDIVIHVDYGAATAVDTLFISNHNFDGYDMQWQWSANDADWNDAVTDWTQSGSGDIVKTLTSSQSARYWRVTIDGADLECGEIVMGLADEFNVQTRPVPRHTKLINVVWSKSVSGQERGIKMGDARRVRTYTLRLDSTDLASFQTIIDDNLNQMSRPMLMRDKDENWFLARFDSVPSLEYLLQDNTRTEIDVTLVEMN